MTEDKETLDGKGHSTGQRRNPNWVNSEGTVRKEEPGRHREVPVEFWGKTLRLEVIAECEEVETRERLVGETGDSKGALGFALLALRANCGERRRGAT